ncbi:hypothetical protein JTB14_015010 [Gonioctena quinquepunctata]|nr:hypothetical protein JTB14_015010 [Gonioctena quinquepunctata]
MAYENITYFEASELCPKTYTNDVEFVFHPQDFPQLKTTQKIDNRITVGQRRLVANIENTNKTKRTYQQAISNTPRKRLNIQPQGYDRESHNSQLLYPNGRPPKQSSQERTKYRAPNCALQKENETDIVQTIFNQFTRISDSYKEKTTHQNYSEPTTSRIYHSTDYQSDCSSY